MIDPIGIVGLNPSQPGLLQQAVRVVDSGPSFGQVLMEKIAEADRTQRYTGHAVARLGEGYTAISPVTEAPRQADESLRVLLQVHRTLQDAYAEISQMRV